MGYNNVRAHRSRSIFSVGRRKNGSGRRSTTTMPNVIIIAYDVRILDDVGGRRGCLLITSLSLSPSLRLPVPLGPDTRTSPFVCARIIRAARDESARGPYNNNILLYYNIRCASGDRGSKTKRKRRLEKRGKKKKTARRRTHII